MKLEPHQRELLDRYPELDWRDIPKDWNGAADLDEKLHLNKQARLVAENAARTKATVRQPDTVSRKELHRELGKIVKVLDMVLAEFERRMGELADAQLKFVGVWRRGQAYGKGSFATHQGSGWHANVDTTAEPGTSRDWTLGVKRGRDGKNGKPAREIHAMA